jgi:hypothetical protein
MNDDDAQSKPVDAAGGKSRYCSRTVSHRTVSHHIAPHDPSSLDGRR